MFIAVFSQYLTNVKVPVPAYKGGLRIGHFPLFRLFPVSTEEV